MVPYAQVIFDYWVYISAIAQDNPYVMQRERGKHMATENTDTYDFGICSHCKPVLQQGMGHYYYACQTGCQCMRCVKRENDRKVYEAGVRKSEGALNAANAER